jgi:hypothetical protein
MVDILVSVDSINAPFNGVLVPLYDGRRNILQILLKYNCFEVR